MRYLAIVFRDSEELKRGIEILLKANYSFTYFSGGLKRIKDFTTIFNQLNHLPSSIIIGELACKNEWTIYPRSEYDNDAYFKIVTIEEFFTNFKEFVPPAYTEQYGN